ncbi:hypothetical protein G5B39_06370 [Rhodobacteraceae bacterium SC52]|nr:hypothetical protein G5B39_06370 [Rhodobacteraceae bacterium SC52]
MLRFAGHYPHHLAGYEGDLGAFFGGAENIREVAFGERAKEWLRTNFGDDVIHARADRDEAAYHIHAVIMPRATVKIAKPNAKIKVVTAARHRIEGNRRHRWSTRLPCAGCDRGWGGVLTAALWLLAVELRHYVQKNPTECYRWYVLSPIPTKNLPSGVIMKPLSIVYGVDALSVCASVATMALADNVEVYATDKLDSIQNGYCIDIAGGQASQADPADGLQGHTCYSPLGEVFVDQAFDSEQFAKGVFYMPEFDVCMQASSLEADAALELATCNGAEDQSFVFAGEGVITPSAAPDLCVTLGDETRFGRSETNQIKALSLAACSADASASQTWAYRTAE